MLPFHLKVSILAHSKTFKMKTRIFILQVYIIFLLLSVSCGRNHFKIDTSGIKVELNIKRLEVDLFTLNPTKIKENIPAFREKYDGFLPYFGYVINIGEFGDSAWAEGLLKFCTDKFNNEVYASTMQIFPDLQNVERQLTEAFRHYRYYFPRKKVPGVYTCITGFNSSIITSDSVLGIGLDKYLGSDSKYYPALRIYKYQSAKMNPFNIVPDCMYAWATQEWLFKEMDYHSDNVLTEIIHEGKLLFFVKSMLPEYDENLIFGFNSNQMKFCKNNEGQIWQYLLEQNLLFSTDQLTRRKLTGEAAFTSYFSKESPGRAAVWLGYRIIDSFMTNSKGVLLEELMKNTDVQGILEKARYDPD
jgi:hypothetical protein